MRKCSHCKQTMVAGFSIHDGERYFCSEDCLHTAYNQAEYDLLYAHDEAYWTDWYEDIACTVS